jgi:hypothetical protein
MVRKRPPLSFPELDSRGRGAILRSSDEVRAEQELLDARGSELVATPDEINQAEDTTDPQADERVSPQVHKPTRRQVGKSTDRQTDNPTSGYVDKSISPQVAITTKPLVRKYTTHLRPETVKAVRRIAFESERKDYQIVQEALDQYLEQLARAAPV